MQNIINQILSNYSDSEIAKILKEEFDALDIPYFLGAGKISFSPLSNQDIEESISCGSYKLAIQASEKNKFSYEQPFLLGYDIRMSIDKNISNSYSNSEATAA